MVFGPRRITRYVLRELFWPTLLGAFLYTFVLLMNHFFIVAEKALSKNLGADLTMRLFMAGIPRLLVLSVPMAVLLGTLIGVGRLSADHEWVALQGTGNGPGVLLRPVLLHGLAGTVVCLVIYGVLVPQANYVSRNLRGEIMLSSNLAADLRPRVFYHLPNAVLFVEEIHLGGQRRLSNVLAIETPPLGGGSTEMVLARQGDLYPAPDSSGALLLDLYDGVGHVYNADEPDSYRLVSGEDGRGFGLIRKRFAPPAYLRTLLDPPNRSVQDLTLDELWDEYREAWSEVAALDGARAAASPGAAPRHDRFAIDRRAHVASIELHRRIALPLACLLFAALALPMGITRVRSGKGAGFALSLVVLLVYWVTFTLTLNQATAGRLSPVLGVWTANFVMLPWIAAGLWRLRRGATADSGGGLLGLAGRGLAAAARGLARLAGRGRRRRMATAADEGADELADFSLSGVGVRPVARLDRYVGVQYLRVLGFSLLSAYLIFALVEGKDLTEGLLRSGASWTLIGRYFQYFWPGVLHIVLPIASLIAAVVAFTLLGRTGELVALRASGVSLRRATLPVLALAGASCALLFLVQDRLAPSFNREARVVKDQIMGRPPRTHDAPVTGNWSFGPEGRRLYNYRLYDADAREFQGLAVFTLDRAGPRVVDHRFARSARWTGAAWELSGGWYRSFPGAAGGPGTYERHEGTITLALDPPSTFTDQQISIGRVGDLPDTMSMNELREQTRELAARGYDVTQLQVAYHGKFAHAAAPLVMVLLGLPFAFRVGRRGSLYGIGVALLLVLVYWATFALFNALGLETLLRPVVAAWAPNVLFGLVGIYMMLWVRT